MPPPKIVSFTAGPASIESGSGSTLAFDTTDATSISITPGSFRAASASGSTTVRPATTTTYTLTASGSAGPATATVKVTVVPPPPPQRGCAIGMDQVPGEIAQGNHSMDRGHYKDALRQYQEALDCDPNNAQAREGLERAKEAIAAE